ncbi:MAG: O-antigen ligase family protein [Lentimicrobium sp.]|jgi:O-antigen ligase|nr:O-antigen ligase family protein [Lentimicrobium sp.]
MKLSKIQRIALYIFLFSINFEVWAPSGIALSTSKITGLIYFATILPNYKYFFKAGYIRHLLTPMWLLFGLLTVVSLININSVSYSFFDFSLFQNMLLFWLLLNHERKDPGILAKGMLAFAMGSIVLAALYYFKIGIAYEGGRVTIFGDNANTVGIRMSVSIFILALYILKNSIGMGKFRYLLIVPIFPMVMLLAETGSRVAFIAFVLQFIVIVLFNKSGRFSLKLFLIIAGSIIGYFTWTYFMEIDVLRIRLTQSLQDRDLAGRDLIWSKVIQVIKSSPIFGVGKTGYASYMSDAYGSVSSPHNVILEILAYTGLIGLYLYLNFLFKIIRIAYASFKINKDLLPLLLFIPFLGLMFSGQLLVVKIGWVILAFAGSKIFSTHPMYIKRNENPLRNR